MGDIIGGHKIILKEYPILPAGTPNKIVTIGTKYDKLPQTLQQSISWSLNQNPVNYPFAQINNQKITLSFKPATADDEQVLQSLLPQGQITDLSQLPSSIPSYLIQVIPELKLDGHTISTGNPMRLGEELPFTTQITYAGRGQIQSPRIYNVIAGSFLVVNAYAGNISPAIFRSVHRKLRDMRNILENSSQSFSTLNREDFLGNLFYVGELGYYTQLSAINDYLGLQNSANSLLIAGIGTFGYEPNVSTIFGIPRAIQAGGIAMDVPMTHISGIKNGNVDELKQFNLKTGIISSILEYSIPEQMFVNSQNPVEAISAIKALLKANASGQRIYHLTKANQSVTFGNIHHDSATMLVIQNALNAGKEVITHTDKVSVSGWSGAGYIILDPTTGAGAYIIAGGSNGGFMQWIDDHAKELAGLSFAMGFAGPLASRYTQLTKSIKL